MGKSKFIKSLPAILFVLLFITVSIAVIIISRGGVLTDNGVILDTGIIRIQTDPDNIITRVFVNNKKTTLTDKRISGLTEGIYSIRIQSEGYADWEKDVKVTQGIVTDVYAKLYPSEFSLTQITKTDIDRAFYSNNGEFVYYVVKNSEFGNEKGIWKLRLIQNQFIFGATQNSPVKIANFGSEIEAAIEAGEYKIIPSPDNNKLIFKDTKVGVNYILDANSLNSLALKPVETTLGFQPQSIYWFNNSNSLIVYNKGILFEHNLTNNINTLIKYEPDKDIIFTVGYSQVFVYDNATNRILGYKNQAVSPVKLENVDLPDTITELHTPSNLARFLIIKSAQGYQYLDLEKSLIKNIGSDLSFYEFAQDGRSATFTRNNKVFTYTVKEIIANNTVETTLSATDFDLSDSADVLRFIPQSSHLLYLDGSEGIIVVTEKDGANKITLVNNKGIKGADFTVDSDGNNLIVLIKDEVEQEGTTSRANLYKIDLDKPKN